MLPSMTVARIVTSMLMTDSVRISVPYGSPKISASASAWRTTPNAHQIMTPNNHTNRKPSQGRFDRSASHGFPTVKKIAVVTTPAIRPISSRSVWSKP